MSMARVARRVATAAAYGGGGVGLLGGVAAGVLLAEVRMARRTIGINDDVPPVADGLYGAEYGAVPGSRVPWRLAFLGDSTAAGLGVQRARETPAALLAAGLAAMSERPVELRNVALSGARSDDLERQVDLVLGPGREPGGGEPGGGGGPESGAGGPRTVPDVCVLIIGANDITGRLSPAASVTYLARAVARLREAGCQVVVGTCPDLGSVEPVWPPLRWLARTASRRLAAAQTIAAVELGGRTVSLGDLLGPEFAARPREMFGPDHYHPSAQGYATAAMAMLPTLCATLGVWPQEGRMETGRRESVLPVERAAAEAVAEGGTEVTAADGGRRAPWALLRHRRRHRAGAEEDGPRPERSRTGSGA
ncbi:SGNH/GDSL hydrolase family protein [Streptomyces sp. YIM 98790]|uniref:SGNH/GDSL hydrolase family protein n=1 Tax=Streptomyces sp. YIM 98790 TaxID=2689077 RepID=UPI00140B589A|nr:SGNH/GDSL hydrolase family protein [Streptomyces sp. YIM 98790]